MNFSYSLLKLRLISLGMLLMTLRVFADNSNQCQPVRLEMTAHDSRFRQTADVEKLLSRLVVSFHTGLHLQDIRYRRVTQLNGYDYGMEIHARGRHLATYRVDERAESTRAVLLVYP